MRCRSFAEIDLVDNKKGDNVVLFMIDVPGNYVESMAEFIHETINIEVEKGEVEDYVMAARLFETSYCTLPECDMNSFEDLQ